MLVDYGYRKHFRINHSPNEFAKGYNHLNSIESFWGYCKVRGIRKNHFYYHLKESEIRFNMKYKNIYKFLLNFFKKTLKVILTLKFFSS